MEHIKPRRQLNEQDFQEAQIHIALEKANALAQKGHGAFTSMDEIDDAINHQVRQLHLALVNEDTVDFIHQLSQLAVVGQVGIASLLEREAVES